MNPKPWQQLLFEKSLMKREKVRLVSKLVDFSGKLVLDLGCAQGIVANNLEKLGGLWIHADNDHAHLRNGRDLLGRRIVQVGENSLPFAADTFQTVLMLDFLEHVDDDRGTLAELHRVLKPGGRLIVSTPVSGRIMLLNRLKKLCGMKPEIYGHKREGYSMTELRGLISAAGFSIVRADTYAKFFMELCEIMLNVFYAKATPGNREKQRSGSISPQSAADLERHGRLFKFYGSFIYPLVRLFTKIDRLLWFKTGYASLVIAEKK